MVFVLFAMRGRVNFTNTSRYTHYHESTMRPQYSQSVDFIAVNLATMQSVNASDLIGVFDCSFLPTSGTQRYSLDRFWSGRDSMTKRGLEISLVGCINTTRKQAWAVDVRQTPAGLATETTKTDDAYTRVNFYLDQIDAVVRHPAFPEISQWVSDGYYAKAKVFDRMEELGKHLITKLRSDANLKYLADGKQRNGMRGKYKTYAGQLIYDDLSRFLDEGSAP